MRWWPFRIHPRAPEPAPRVPPRPPLAARLRSRNGYEREEAVHEARRLADGALLPLLLERANDWVPQVRLAALAALRVLMHEEFLPHWCANLDAVVALERASRADHGELLAESRTFLAQPASLPSVLAAGARGKEPVKRFVFELLWSATQARDRTAALRDAITGSDRFIARIALSLLDQVEAPAERLALLRLGCASRITPVRAQSLRLLLATGDPAATALAEALCLDPAAAVRGVAWHHIGRTARAEEVVREAHDRLQTATSLADQCAALASLVLADPEGATPAWHQALRSQQPRLRAIALAALLSRPSASQEELLLAGLRDASSRVQAVAARAISRGAAPPPPEVVMAIARAHGTAAALGRAFGVLARSSFWERLALLLEAVESELPPGGAELGNQALAQWRKDSYNNFMPLPDDLRARLLPLWQRVAPRVPAPLRDEIAFQLR